MSIQRVSPENIKVSTSEAAFKVTQVGRGDAFVVEDSESPDSSAFVIDSQGRVGIKKTPSLDLDIDGIINATNVNPGYTSTTTSGATTVLNVSSTQQQFFTGSSDQTITLPVASTLTLGHFFTVHNNSTGALTVNSSGGNLVLVVPPRSTAQFTCILTSGTTAASWDADIAEGSGYETTATSGSTTVLNVSSAQRQFFTGSSNQTVTLPVVSTLTLGQYYIVHNNSTGTLTVNSSGGNLVLALPPAQTATFTAIATTGTDETVWDVDTYKTVGYETTATSAGTKTLTLASAQQQFFTGSTTHTVDLPVTDTLVLGDYWVVHNNSTGNVTVRSSGGNNVVVLPPGTSVQCTCILTSGTTAASWDAEFVGNNSITGTGSFVLSASPTLTGTPAAPTASAGTNTTQIATTAFVRNELSDLVSSAPTTLDTLNELAAALGDDPNFATTVTDTLALKANILNATFTGTPTVTSNSSTLLNLKSGSSDHGYIQFFLDSDDQEVRSAYIGSPNDGSTVFNIDNQMGGDINLITTNASVNLVNSDFLVGSNSFFVDQSADYVGIGTTTPAVDLEIENSSGPQFHIHNGSINDSFYIRAASSTQVRLEKRASSGSPLMDIDVQPTDGTSSSSIRIFRNTNTTGGKSVTIYRGNGTTTVDHNLTSGSGSTSFLCNNGGSLGIGTSNPGYTLEVNGSFAATTKSFDIEHPTKEGQRLQHGSLEGPELGVYVRGKGAVGSPVELPDYWTGLVDDDSITVQVTAIGTAATLYVADISENTVTIGGSEEGVEFFYFIQAERKDVDKLVVEYGN